MHVEDGVYVMVVMKEKKFFVWKLAGWEMMGGIDLIGQMLIKK